MKYLVVAIASTLVLAACSGGSGKDKTPTAEPNPACADVYQPLACIDGNNVCTLDENGCETCTCEPDQPIAPGEDPDAF